MEIRKILAPLSGRRDPDDPETLDIPALRAALHLARHFEAGLEVLSVIGAGGPQETGWLSWVPDYGMDAVLDVLEKQGDIRRKRARRSYDAVIEAAGGQEAAAAEFVERAGEIGPSVAAAGRLADLIVVANSVSRWEQPFRPILDASLRWTGRPIFVTPQSVPDGSAQHVAIAWDDTAQAARAVAGAMPFLRRAGSVTVLTAPEEDAAAQGASPERLAEYLDLHGIAARARTVGGRHRDVPAALIDASLEERADLLVLGSVIHSRAHSLVYGSLTEEVLKAPRMNALLVP